MTTARLGFATKLLGFAVTSAVAVGCGAPAQSWSTIALEKAGRAAPTVPPKTETFLVWTSQDGGETTRLVSVTSETPTELAETEGAVVVWDEHAYRFVAEEVEAPSYACDFTTGNQPELPEKAVTHRGLLVELGGKSRAIVWAGGNTAGMNEYNDSTEIQASVGPYVSVSSGEWGYSCGAHGNWGRSSLVWDLRSQKAVELLTATERARIDATERLEARSILDTDDRGGDPGPLALDDVALVEEVPTFEKGLIGLQLHFVASACYACSDGAWASYSRSARVGARDLPAAIAPFAKPLPWLGVYARRHADAQIGGVSEVDDVRSVPGLSEALHPVTHRASE